MQNVKSLKRLNLYLMVKDNLSDFAPLVLKLLQGVLYDDDTKTWNELYRHHSKIKRYFAQIGIEFHFDEKEGYAFLSQPDYKDTDIALPRLTTRRALSYQLTMLLVVLRELLDDFDASTTLTTKKCYKTQQELKGRVELLFKEKANQSKLILEIEKYIGQAVQYGFLKLNIEDKTNPMNHQYEIKRIIRAKVSLEDLEFIKEKLNQSI